MNSGELTELLTTILGCMIFVLVLLVMIYLFIRMKNNKKKNEPNTKNSNTQTSTGTQGYDKQSIFNFMEFDKIEDNMIIQKNGTKYLMVVECQGVNYDLMSGIEKTSVEEGFLQFLNTLRHPIQIYTQTRTVNLGKSISTYKARIDQIESDLRMKETDYQTKLKSGRYTKEQLDKEYYELTKQRNLYEYGKDVIFNTERMSSNKNVLNKKYYIIVPYYPEDLGNNNFDKEEIKNIAFSELYTRAQSVIRTLSACGINGKILGSNLLADLLYVAYNRDEEEVFGLDKALAAGYDELYSTAPDVLDKKMKELDNQIQRKAMEMANDAVIYVAYNRDEEEVFGLDKALAAGYDELYSTAPDVLDKKMKELDNQIQRKAMEMANDAVIYARSEKQRKVEEKQNNMDDLIAQMAKLIVQENMSFVGEDIAKSAINKIEGTEEIEEQELEEYEDEDEEEQPTPKKRGRRKINKEDTEEEGGIQDVKEEKKTTRTRRTTKTA